MAVEVAIKLYVLEQHFYAARQTKRGSIIDNLIINFFTLPTDRIHK